MSETTSTPPPPEDESWYDRLFGPKSKSFLDVITDPRVAGLLGMTAKFGEMSAPSPRRRSWSETLGAGVGGLLGGVQSGQALQKSGMENEVARRQLDWSKNYQDSLARKGNVPFGAPGNSNQFLVDPNLLASLIPIVKPSEVPKLVSSIQHYSGGPGSYMRPDGTAGMTPGGTADPAVMAREAFVKARGGKQGDAPYVAPIEKVVQIADKQGRTPGMTGYVPTTENRLMRVEDANAAAGASNNAMAPPTEDPFPEWARRINARENGTGDPAARNQSGPGGTPASSAKGNSQAIESTWRSVFSQVRPDLLAGKTDAEILAMRDIPALAQAFTEQYGRQNGSYLAQRGLPVTGGTVDMAHFLGPDGAVKVMQAKPDTPLAMLLGGAVMKANPHLAGMTAGGLVQKFQNGMAGQSDPVMKGGSVTPQGIRGAPVQTAQEKTDMERETERLKSRGTFHTITDPGTGNVVPAHIEPAPYGAPPGTPGKAIPAVLGGGGPVVSTMAPQIIEARKKAVDSFVGPEQKAYSSAQNTHAWLEQIDHAADVMNQAGTAYMTGPYAEYRLGAMAGINDILRTMGVKAPFDEKAISSFEEMKKATTTAGFELSNKYEGGARQAASTIMNATSAVPGPKNSPEGQKLVSAGIREGAQSAMDLHEYKQKVFDSTNGAGLASADSEFYKRNPAELYAKRAISTAHPYPIASTDQATAMRQMSEYLPGTMVRLHNGKITMVPARSDAPPIPNYLMRRMISGGGASVR